MGTGSMRRAALAIRCGWRALGKETNTNRIMAMATLGIFLTSAIYAIFAYLQWDAMRGQLKKMGKSNDLSREALIADQRPWLSIDIEPAGPITWEGGGFQ